MGMNAKVAMFALMGLAACQGQTDETKTTADSATRLQRDVQRDKPSVTTGHTAPKGLAFCLQSEQAFQNRFPVVVYKDTAGFCHPCNAVVHKRSEIKKYPHDNVVLVKEGTSKVPAIIDAATMADYARQIRENCDVKTLKPKHLSPPGSERQFWPIPAGRPGL